MEIPLTRGYFAVIDDEDSDLAEFKWFTQKSKNNFYATRTPRIDGVKYNLRMHRLIFARKIGRELLQYEIIDHIDGNGLNNRRSNLRLATNSQNAMNQRRQAGRKYKGVSKEKTRNKWRAQITIGRKKIHIGCYDSQDEAYRAYCEKAKELFGEFWRPE